MDTVEISEKYGGNLALLGRLGQLDVVIKSVLMARLRIRISDALD